MITALNMRSLLEYRDGAFYHLRSSGNVGGSDRTGKPAGSLDTTGKRWYRVNGKLVRHDVMVALWNEAPPSADAPGPVAYKNNRLGLRGIVQRGARFRAMISVQGKNYALGSYGSATEAQAAYSQAETAVKEGRFHEFYQSRHTGRRPGRGPGSQGHQREAHGVAAAGDQ